MRPLANASPAPANIFHTKCTEQPHSEERSHKEAETSEPAPRLDTPLPLPQTAELPSGAAFASGQIVSNKPLPWQPDWMTRIFELVAPPGNALNVEVGSVLLARAKPMFHLALVDRAWNTVWTNLGGQQYRKELAAMRWTFQLSKQRPIDSGRLQSSIKVLVDTDAYGPNLPHAPSRHTLVLMIEGWGDLLKLYCELSKRAVSKTEKPQHMDLARLPRHAVLAACLMLDQNGEQFEEILAAIHETLPDFAPEVQAQVHSDLCAFFLQSDKECSARHERALKELGTPASEELEKINRFVAVASPFFAGEDVGRELVGDLFGTLPAAGEPWDLMALAAMQILSGLHIEEGVLMPAQIQAFVQKTVEMVRYFLALKASDTIRHPLNAVIRNLFNNLSLVDAFMQLSIREQIGFLNVLQTNVGCAFAEELFRRVLPADILQLADAILEILKQESAGVAVNASTVNAFPLLQEWLSKARRCH